MNPIRSLMGRRQFMAGALGATAAVLPNIRPRKASSLEGDSKMTTETTVTQGRNPAPYPPKDHWEYNLYVYHEGLADRSHFEFITSPGVDTPVYWADWCRAIFYAGTTLYLWNEIPDVKAAFLSECSVNEGQSVFLIAKYADESGLAPALRSLVGKPGNLVVEEIGDLAITALTNASTAPGTKLQWDFDCLDSVPDRSLDRVILFGAASHVANWDSLADQIGRVLRDGGRLIIAEAPLGGREFNRGVKEDSHFESFILRVLSGIGIHQDELPDCSAEDLAKLFRKRLSWSRHFSWQGIYIFYGQKAGKESDPAPMLLKSTDEVRTFLQVKPTESLWDLMSKSEKSEWASTVADIHTPHMGKCVTWGGGALCWNWRNQRTVTDIMWSNLLVKPGDKAMMICEFPEDLGTLDELQRRLGEKGEIVLVNMTASPKSYDYKGWQAKRKMYMEQGSPEEWPYDFADDYPDNHFDLIFLPQGVHHSNNWLRDAPRLLRTLKPGCQFMSVECGINRPEMTAAREISALARIVGDRVFNIALPSWLVGELSPAGPLPPGSGYEHEGRPYHDVSTEHLRESFGDSLVDVCSLEHKGWILFWGYKK